ncbi:MAG: biotin/lipoyl-binding protein, partial [Mesorhizobium sp.]
MTKTGKNWLVLAILLILAVGGYQVWQRSDNGALPEGFAAGNGRVEAVEIDISTKSPGRLKEILADEGDFVKAGDALARMDTTQLEAQRRQAEAQLQRARIGVDTAGSLVAQREAEKTAAEAVVAQRQAELDAAQRTLARTEQLAANNTV